MKHILLILSLAIFAVAGTTNIQKVEKYIENRDCKRVVISESKKVTIYRLCSDTYVIKHDDFKNYHAKAEACSTIKINLILSILH